MQHEKRNWCFISTENFHKAELKKKKTLLLCVDVCISDRYVTFYNFTEDVIDDDCRSEL